MTPPVARGRRLRRTARAIACCGALLLAGRAAAAVVEGGPPYPRSTTITDFRLDWGTYRRLAPGSDNWPTTWAGDGNVYTAWGDGPGFGATRVSLGFARLVGNSAASVHGFNLPSDVAAGKSYGLLALGSTLYAWISPGSNAANYDEARLYAAPLGTDRWKAAGWAFTKDDAARLILPTFLQGGKDYAQAGDPDHVYVYAARYDPKDPGQLSTQGASGRSGEIALLRASRTADLLASESWEFYAGVDGSGQPVWSPDPGQLKPVASDKKGVGWTVSAAYDPGLKLYLLATEHGTSFASQYTLLESPNPEGPWHTAAYMTLADPRGRVRSTAFYYNFLADSFSKSGKRFTLVFTGTGNADALNLVDGSFTVKSGGGGGGSGNGNGNSGGNGSNGSSNSSSGTGCTTITTTSSAGSSSTAQTSGSGASGNVDTSSTAQGSAGGTGGSAGGTGGSAGGTGGTGISTDTGCTGDTGATSGTVTTFAGGGSSGSTGGQTTGQQGIQTTQQQQGQQSSGTGSASFSLDPRSFRRDTGTGAGAPPDETGCDTGGTRLLTRRGGAAGAASGAKGGAAAKAEAASAGGDEEAAAAEASPGTPCGSRKNHPPDPANARPAPLRLPM
jgi:hypothetical protein